MLIVGVVSSVLAAGYVGAVGYLKLNEPAFIFYPAERRVAAPASRFELREKRVTYPSTDGVTLSARDLGINLFAFDYRGFRESSGTPDERGLYDDATASYQCLIRSPGVPSERIVLFGHSLGSGVAIELASRVPCTRGSLIRPGGDRDC
jgi:fermentation-respiration switch protein FrsA (DUF1100 family)